MKRNRLFPFGAVLAFALAPALSAAVAGGGTSEPGAGNAPATPQWFADWSPAERLPKWLNLGGEIRGRMESTSGTALSNTSADTYYLNRLRVHFGVRATSWLRFFAEMQDARVEAYNPGTAPGTLYNPFDLRQGYIELSTHGRLNFNLRAGRQELSFGGQRLIGPADWNMSKTFDALDLAVTRGKARVDLLAGSLVAVDPTRFDRHKPGEHFYGAYGALKDVGAGISIEPYLLFKQTLLIKSETGIGGDALVVSPGVRLFGKAPGRLDYVVELVVQRGSYSSDAVKALGQSYVLGWTITNKKWKPRLSAEYSYASGDATSKDGLRGTFDQFYPSNHGNYGMIDQFGWKNLKNWRGGVDFQITRKIRLRSDINDFSLATVQDCLYNSSGTSVVLNRKATDAHIGWESNTVALYQWSKVWKFGAGYGHLFAGAYLEQAKMTGGYTYPYVFFTGMF
jgi:Alginate export